MIGGHLLSSLISVVIPCYRQAQFVGMAIESALAQRGVSVEIIVVDDGSPDHVDEAVARYPSVRYLRQVNKGLAAARNAGLHASTGQYIAFLDADDAFQPDALRIGLEQFCEGAAFVCGQHTFMDADGKPLAVTLEQRIVTAGHYHELLRSNFIGCPATVLYRHDVLLKVAGFDGTFRGSEDYGLYLTIARDFPIVCHPHQVAIYRRHAAQMTSNIAGQGEAIVGMLRTHLETVTDPEAIAACRQGIAYYEKLHKSELIVQRARDASRAGQWRTMAGEVWRLFRQYPDVLVTHALRKLARGKPWRHAG